MIRVRNFPDIITRRMDVLGFISPWNHSKSTPKESHLLVSLLSINVRDNSQRSPILEDISYNLE